MRNALSTIGKYHVKLGIDVFGYRTDRRYIEFWRCRRHGRQHRQNSVCCVLGAVRERLDHGPPGTCCLICEPRVKVTLAV